MSTADPIDETRYRDACGQFASGVTVVTTAESGTSGEPGTTAEPGTSGEPGTAHGMTASAFMSVSLDPPLIAVSVDETATMHDWLHETGRYGVSVLADWQEDYCWHFAGQPQEDLDVTFSWVDDVPLVDHALAHFVADVEDAHPAGDHTLFIGRVRHLASDPVDATQPLIVHEGRVAELLEDDHSGYTWHPSF